MGIAGRQKNNMMVSWSRLIHTLKLRLFWIRTVILYRRSYRQTRRRIRFAYDFYFLSGLSGLASYVAEQRRKEIGIRKVLGATVFNLWRLLSGEFVGLVIISCLIATPLAWYFLHQWLQHYEFRTTVPWWIFAAAGTGALLITLFTVSLQAIKAALINPVNSLRPE